MKIAVASRDKVKIDEHFGSAPYFVVFDVDGENVQKAEVREKPCHEQLSQEERHPQVDEKGRHGFAPDASARHKDMGDVVKDCGVIIAGRMGQGAYTDLVKMGFNVIATDTLEAGEAASLFAKGKLTHDEERLH